MLQLRTVPCTIDTVNAISPTIAHGLEETGAGYLIAIRGPLDLALVDVRLEDRKGAYREGT